LKFGVQIDHDEYYLTRNSSADEIANVNFLRQHRTRTTAHNKVHFAYGKNTGL